MQRIRMTTLYNYFLLDSRNENSLKQWGKVGKLEKLVRVKKASFNIGCLVSVCLECSGLD